MAESREVVVTGIGVISPIGLCREDFLTALRAGESGVRVIARFPHNLPVRIGAEVNDFDPKQYVKPRKSLKVMSREIQMGVSAANLAMDSAGLSKGAVDPDRMGVVLGADMLYSEPVEVVDLFRSCLHDGKFDFDQFGDQVMSQLFPLWMLKYLPNMIASHVGIAHDARGPNNTIVSGEVSSLLAVMEAAKIVQRGDADVMLTGGAGSRLSLGPLLYRGGIDCSHRNDDPAGASRPFDRDRDGMVNGEGAAVLVLESHAHAVRRGAGILARVVSFGCAHRGAVNGREGQQAAVEASIRRALVGVPGGARAIGHVNAHGLGTRDGDRAESQAIRAVLGDMPVTAPKSFFGNLGAGGGAVELAASLWLLPAGQIPFTRNFLHPAPDCPVRVVHDQFLASPVRSCLALNQSSMGQAAAVVFQHADT
jgi:3-oxoacyl-[acyl-carrier-protein] synthase II